MPRWANATRPAAGATEEGTAAGTGEATEPEEDTRAEATDPAAGANEDRTAGRGRTT